MDKGTAFNEVNAYNLRGRHTLSSNLNSNLFKRSSSQDIVVDRTVTGQTTAYKTASSANPLVGVKEVLNSSGLSDVIIEGINDIEAGRNRD